MCLVWSGLEYVFAYTIWHLLGLSEDTGKIVTGGLDMLPRANMAINLSRQLKAPASLTKALMEARKTIQDGLDTRRNECVHGVHFGNATSEVVRIEVHRGKGDRSKKVLTNADIHGLLNELNIVREYLIVAVNKQGIYEPAKAAHMAKKMRAAAFDTVSEPPSES